MEVSGTAKQSLNLEWDVDLAHVCVRCLQTFVRVKVSKVLEACWVFITMVAVFSFMYYRINPFGSLFDFLIQIIKNDCYSFYDLLSMKA